MTHEDAQAILTALRSLEHTISITFVVMVFVGLISMVIQSKKDKAKLDRQQNR